MYDGHKHSILGEGGHIHRPYMYHGHKFIFPSLVNTAGSALIGLAALQGVQDGLFHARSMFRILNKVH